MELLRPNGVSADWSAGDKMGEGENASEALVLAIVAIRL